MKRKIITFKGIEFYNCTFKYIFRKLKKGGYLVAPAASALSSLEKNKNYHNSLKNADIAILDSGFFCILLRIFKKIKVKKLSGYFFLNKFLNSKFKKSEKFLTIDPNIDEAKANISLLKKKKIFKLKSYVAPFYDKKVVDKKLLKLARVYRPKYVIINLGGQKQEILALYLKKNLNFKLSIICTGAAIAFLTKKQAPINDFVDKFYLGWIVRLIYNPKNHLLRTIKSIFLIKLFLF